MPALEQGQRLAGRYELVRPLGRGSRGEVWLATGTTDGATVALKFVAGAAAARAEAELAARVAHPHVVRALGWHEDGGHAFIVQEYVADARPAGALRAGGWRTVLAALAGVADALDHAHRRGVVHGDLKPSNVLCDGAGHCRLADFGAAAGGEGNLPATSPQRLAGAPVTPADDVYGFGALLVDLLAGQPPFHPGITAARVRDEPPALPVADLAGDPLPPALVQLLRSLLHKEPTGRPPGMAAVRSALEEILADAAAPSGAVRAAPPASAPATAAPRPRGATPRWVWPALVALVAVAFAVILVLPRYVAHPGAPPVAAVTAAVPASRAPGPAPAAPAGDPAKVEAVLRDLLPLQDALGKAAAERWGGEAWAQLRTLAGEGDARYRERDFAAAAARYEAALGVARELQSRQAGVLADALKEGEAALQAGDAARAADRFGLAAAIDASNAEAAAGVARAKRLPEAVARFERGRAAEQAGDRAAALRAYREAAAVDGRWRMAGEAVARLSSLVSRDEYDAAMARGIAAAARRDFATAKPAFEAALKVRPGDATAQAALDQLAADAKTAGVLQLVAEAQDFEAREQWPDAVRRYEAAAAADPAAAPLQEGLARARSRADLAARLDRALANGDHLNDDAVLRQGQDALAAARSVPAPGPVLRRQAEDLDRLLRAAATPVRVTLESDNITDVAIFRVGRLGPFANRTIDLRPGTYVAVGTRQGYRDVRRSFVVKPDGSLAAIVIRCEEAI